jgi:hypothetical protein
LLAVVPIASVANEDEYPEYEEFMEDGHAFARLECGDVVSLECEVPEPDYETGFGCDNNAPPRY